MKFNYQCVDCGKDYKPDPHLYLCPACSSSNTSALPPAGVLKTIYDYGQIQKEYTFSELKEQNWLPLLPLKDMRSWPNLKVGGTPIYKFRQWGKELLGFDLLIKDDSQNPSFSFKDRASALVSAYAKEKKIDTIITASTGNAGTALACMCANQGQKAIVLVPEKAPVAKLAQIIMYGAEIRKVNGTYDDAFEESLELTRKHGWYNRNTGFNPLTIEGKKTVSLEIFDQLNGKLPDHIFVPTGDGVILSGVYKGFEDLIKLKLIEKMPVIVSVQSAGSDNLNRNLKTDRFEIRKSMTLADSISVDVPKNFFMSKNYLLKYNGLTVTVTDHEILDASARLARETGIFAEPAASAAMAGLIQMKVKGQLAEGTTNLVLSTGSGLKDISVIKKMQDSGIL